MRASYRIAISLLLFITLYPNPANAWQAVPAQGPLTATRPPVGSTPISAQQQKSSTILTIDRSFQLPILNPLPGIGLSAKSITGTVVYLDNNDPEVWQSARAACANVQIPSSQIDPAILKKGTHLYYLTNQTGSTRSIWPPSRREVRKLGPSAARYALI